VVSCVIIKYYNRIIIFYSSILIYFNCFGSQNGSQILNHLSIDILHNWVKYDKLLKKEVIGLKYENIKTYSAEEFRRVTGVKRPTFDKMVEILQGAEAKRRSKGGPKPDLSLEE